MSRERMLVLALAAVTAVGAGCRGWESEEPPVHLVRNMDTQRRGKAYRTDISGLFENGQLMREPVEGTVARGMLEEDATWLAGLDAEGKPTLKYPERFKSAEARARGAIAYKTYCSPCHGREGDGKGTVKAQVLANGNTPAQPGLLVPPPSLLDARIKSMPVGQIYAAINNGVNPPNMPSYAPQMTVADRWATVAWVRAMQLKADPTVVEEGGSGPVVVAKTSKASVEHGEQLFNAKICVTCHSLDGSRKVGPSFKGLWGKTESTDKGDVTVDEAYIRESIVAPMAKVVAGYPPAMPPAQLDDVEMQSMILFIQAQK